MSESTATGRSEVFDYRALRLSVGVIALTLPIVLPAGQLHFSFAEIKPSISAYYHTGMRDVFVGSLFAIAMFLLAYNGKETRDAVASRVACLAAVGVALFPTINPDSDFLPTDIEKLKSTIHSVSAGVLFGILAIFCLVFFRARLALQAPLTPKQQRRRRVYAVCGWVIVGCIVGLAVSYALRDWPFRGWREASKIVFFLEQIALVAFAVSWFTAGKWAALPFLVDPQDAYHFRRGDTPARIPD
ncbi:MAG: DUF998 domain-containing protein [Myxococcota bacterium]